MKKNLTINTGWARQLILGERGDLAHDPYALRINLKVQGGAVRMVLELIAINDHTVAGELDVGFVNPGDTVTLEDLRRVFDLHINP